MSETISKVYKEFGKEPLVDYAILAIVGFLIGWNIGFFLNILTK